MKEAFWLLLLLEWSDQVDHFSLKHLLQEIGLQHGYLRVQVTKSNVTVEVKISQLKFKLCRELTEQRYDEKFPIEIAFICVIIVITESTLKAIF